MAERKLTPKQARFLLAYLESGNASAAYRASYNASRLCAQGVRNEASALLKHPLIAPRVAEARAKLAEKTAEAAERWGVTGERLIEEYARIAFFDIGQVARWNAAGELVLADSAALSAAERAGIASVALEASAKGTRSVKITTSGKLAALDSLARILGLFDKEKPGSAEESPLNLTITIA
jgi:phage terminase small subunit